MTPSNTDGRALGDELLSCPFCGGSAMRRGEFIECSDCSAQGPTDREAKTGWNTRATVREAFRAGWYVNAGTDVEPAAEYLAQCEEVDWLVYAAHPENYENRRSPAPSGEMGREAETQINAIAALETTEEADIDFLAGQLGLGRGDTSERNIIRSFRKQIILAALPPSPSASVPGEGVTTAAEIQSGMDRQKWAENLILQLPGDHDGRNSWLLNYGRTDFARDLRRQRKLTFNEQSQAVNPPAPQPGAQDAVGEAQQALRDVRQELWVDYCLHMGRTDTDPRPFNSKPHIRIIDTALQSARGSEGS